MSFHRQRPGQTPTQAGRGHGKRDGKETGRGGTEDGKWCSTSPVDGNRSSAETGTQESRFDEDCQRSTSTCGEVRWCGSMVVLRWLVFIMKWVMVTQFYYDMN